MANLDHASRKQLRDDLAARIPPELHADDRALLAWARDQGILLIDAIVLLRMVCGISLGNAKDRVYASNVWADEHAALDAIHTEIIAALSSVDDDGAQSSCE